MRASPPSSKAEGMRKTQSVVCGVFVCLEVFCVFVFSFVEIRLLEKSPQVFERCIVLICLHYFMLEKDSYHRSFHRFPWN